MSKTDVGYAELHDSVNFGGRNFADKRLDSAKVHGLTMVWDYEKDKLIATLGKVTVIFPSAGVKYYVEGPSPHIKVAQISHPMVLGSSGTAQVESPMSYVHAGPGRGKTGK